MFCQHPGCGRIAIQHLNGRYLCKKHETKKDNEW